MFSKHLSGSPIHATNEPGDGWQTYRSALELIERAEWADALEQLAEAETLFHDADELHGLWRALLGQALLHWREGASALAIARASAALRAAEQSDDGMAVGCVTWQLANMLLGLGEHRKAADYFDQAQLALDAVGAAPPGGVLAAAAQLCFEIARWKQMYERQQIGRREAEQAITDIQQLLIARLNQAAGALRSASLIPSSVGMPEMLLMMPSAPVQLDLPGELAPIGLSTWLGRLWRRLIYGDDLAAVATLGQAPPLELPPAGLGDTVAHLDLSLHNTAHLADAPTRAEGDTQPGFVRASAPLLADVALPYVGETLRMAEAPARAVAPAPEPIASATPAQAGAPGLQVHLLGPFRVSLNGQPIESWPSARGRALLKYLLTYRERPLPRDVLMEKFWPEATPESARNSLNVAMHGLRQALRAAGEQPVVIFQNGSYQLSPDLQVWIDVEEFRRRVQAGRRHEDAGSNAAAAAEYEQAAALYGGDFMADDLADDWPVLPRERLRVAYLDTLERLSTISFEGGQFVMCISLCQQLLAHDACREDTHCRLMRCYSRQGQHHLALRQYQLCAEALRGELDVEPAPATTQLYERIKQREAV